MDVQRTALVSLPCTASAHTGSMHSEMLPRQAHSMRIACSAERSSLACTLLRMSNPVLEQHSRSLQLNPVCMHQHVTLL